MRFWFRSSQLASGARHPRHPGWMEYTQSLVVSNHRVRLRPISRDDGPVWSELRIDDADILELVEPTVIGTWESAHTVGQWREMFHNLAQSADAGLVVPFALEVDGAFSGQLTIGSIQHGTVSDCWVGYWLHSSLVGRGIATAACALGVDHAFYRVGVHRVTATYLPDNYGSQRVLQKNGFVHEGYLRRNLHINGQWRDHVLVAINAEDYADSCVQRLVRSGGAHYG